MTRRLFTLALAATAAFGVTIPRPSGDLTISTHTGPAMISQHRGKVVAVLFMMTNCKDCQDAVKALTPIQRDLGPKGLQVLAGAFNPEAQVELIPLLSRMRPSFPIGLIEFNKVVAFTQVTPAMKPTAPILAIVDRKGVVRAQYMGTDKIFQGDANKNLRAEFEKYLNAK